MDRNFLPGNDFGPTDARNLLAALMFGRSGPVKVLDVTASAPEEESYLTPAVVDAYARLVAVVNRDDSEDLTLDFAMSVPEGGRLLQLAIEGAMAHAREHVNGEPWFTCSTGLRIVCLAVDVFTGLVDQVKYE